MTNLVSQKTNNYQFAPGVSLYGVDGKDGKSGLSGTSIFISQFDIDTTSDLQTFASYIRQGRSTALGSAEYIGRSYMTGDSFLFPNGYIYKIKDISAIIQAGDTISTNNFDNFFEFVGRITVNNEENGFVDSNERLVLDTTNYKGFVINVSELSDTELKKIESPMTIISDKISNDENIKFIDLKSILSGQADVQFRIQYDTNNKCFMIESDNPILVNADLEVAYSDTNSSMTYDEYSKVYTTQMEKSEAVLTTFRSICDNLNWQIVSQEDGKLYKVLYEFYPENNLTNQIYYYNKTWDNIDWSSINDNSTYGPDNKPTYGPDNKQKINSDDLILNDTDYLLWKYNMDYAPEKKYKTIKIHACYNSRDLNDLPWEFKLQFRTSENNPRKTFRLLKNEVSDSDNSNIVKKDIDGNWLVQDENGNPYNMIGSREEAKYVPGYNGGRIYIVKTLTVPSDASELWISAPKCFYNIVYGDSNIEIKNEEHDYTNYELEKIELLLNGKFGWEYENEMIAGNGKEAVRFPIDVLKYVTERYDTEFKIKNENRQAVYKLPDNAIFKFVGKLNDYSEEGYDATIVDREYYYAVPNSDSGNSNKDVIEPGGEAYIILSSYNDPSQINWTVSVIGQTEFVIEKYGTKND